MINIGMPSVTKGSAVVRYRAPAASGSRPKLRIIYTPNADRFSYNDISIGFTKYVNDPETAGMRKAYAELKEGVIDLPKSVGVVTYNNMFKNEAKKLRDEMAAHGVKHPTTTYLPLDILESALRLKKEDVSNLLTGQYCYRSLFLLCTHASVLMDKSLPPKMQYGVALASAIPGMTNCLNNMSKLIAKLRELGKGHSGLVSKLSEEEAHLKELFTWSDIESLHAFILARFETNHVSRSFPLNFLPPYYLFPSIYSVSLLEKIEEMKSMAEFVRIIRLGCENSGDHARADEAIAHLKGLAKDFFGKTERVNSIKDLLDPLPEPKTIITDMYIMDHFPELQMHQMETIEYLPSSQPE